MIYDTLQFNLLGYVSFVMCLKLYLTASKIGKIMYPIM